MNLRRGNADIPVTNYSQDSEVQQIIRKLAQDIKLRDGQIADLQKLLQIYEETLISAALSPRDA